MKPYLTQIALRLRALRKSRHQTQESLAAKCRYYGFPILRCQLAKYEIGLLNIPAQFIPIAAHALNVNITDLLPPIGPKDPPKSRPEPGKIRNLSGKRIRFFRKRQKWTQDKLATVLEKMGFPITRNIIASVEMQRTRVRDYQLVFFAKALQIPLNSLFPDEAGFAKSTGTSSARHGQKIHSRSMG